MGSKVAKVIMEYFKKGDKKQIREAARVLGYKSPETMLAHAHMKAPYKRPLYGKGVPGDEYRWTKKHLGPNRETGSWHEPYVSVYKPISGYKAILRDRTGEPIQTGFQGYATKKEAIAEAKGWAEAEGLEFWDDLI